MTVTRVRRRSDVAELLSYLGEREPAATPALAPLLRPRWRRDAKAWVVEAVALDGGSGSASGSGSGSAGGRGPVGAARSRRVTGAYVTVRYCRGRWNGVVLLDDPDDRETLAALGAVVERSNACSVAGPAAGLRAVVAHVPRARRPMPVWFYALEPQPVDPALASVGLPGWDATVRPARPEDEATLFELYADYELNAGIPRRALRAVVRRRVAAGAVLVAEDQGRVVGAVAAVGDTGGYRIVDSLVVRSEARGRSVGTALFVAATRQAMALGLGVCAHRAPTNGMRVTHEQTTEVAAAVESARCDLRPLRLFPGHRRLRRAFERLQGDPVRPPKPRRSPYSQTPEWREEPAR